ncbi:MAG TPA: hypothetical protein VFA75_00290 [Nevskia sp.]|nr:hypothetical protein [Nevskia sp.]
MIDELRSEGAKIVLFGLALARLMSPDSDSERLTVRAAPLAPGWLFDCLTDLGHVAGPPGREMALEIESVIARYEREIHSQEAAVGPPVLREGVRLLLDLRAAARRTAEGGGC